MLLSFLSGEMLPSICQTNSCPYPLLPGLATPDSLTGACHEVKVGLLAYVVEAVLLLSVCLFVCLSARWGVVFGSVRLRFFSPHVAFRH
jgi:hypothetical protein